MSTLETTLAQEKICVLPREPRTELTQDIQAAKVELVMQPETREILAIPLEIYERVKAQDPSVKDKQYAGFYVSPSFFYYRTKKDFEDFNWG